MADRANTSHKRLFPQRLIGDLEVWLGLIGLGFAWLVALGPLVMLGWQTLTWLRYGFWDSWPISRTLALGGIFEPYLSWVGVQTIVHFLFEMPTAFALMLLGLAGLMVVGGLLSLIEKCRERPRIIAG